MNRTARLFVVSAFALLALACGKRDKTEKTAAHSSDSTASAPAVASYRAFGNEPFWSVFVNTDGLRFISPEDSAGIHFPPVEPVAAGDTLRWKATSERGSIDVRIWPGACSDGMSDTAWKFSSAVQLNETTYLGCAEQVLGNPVR
ncbi:MAG TPA: hypothetical protein VF247_06260 [Candidatus Krumholzibacteria bacterium]